MNILNRKKLVLFVFFHIAIFSYINAQTIKGRVYWENNANVQVISNCKLTVLDMNLSSTTDKFGLFTINLPKQESAKDSVFVLVEAYGYLSRVIRIGIKSLSNIRLERPIDYFNKNTETNFYDNEVKFSGFTYSNNKALPTCKVGIAGTPFYAISDSSGYYELKILYSNILSLKGKPFILYSSKDLYSSEYVYCNDLNIDPKKNFKKNFNHEEYVPLKSIETKLDSLKNYLKKADSLSNIDLSIQQAPNLYNDTSLFRIINNLSQLIQDSIAKKELIKRYLDENEQNTISILIKDYFKPIQTKIDRIDSDVVSPEILSEILSRRINYFNLDTYIGFSIASYENLSFYPFDLSFRTISSKLNNFSTLIKGNIKVNTFDNYFVDFGVAFEFDSISFIKFRGRFGFGLQTSFYQSNLEGKVINDYSSNYVDVNSFKDNRISLSFFYNGSISTNISYEIEFNISPRFMGKDREYMISSNSKNELKYLFDCSMFEVSSTFFLKKKFGLLLDVGYNHLSNGYCKSKDNYLPQTFSPENILNTSFGNIRLKFNAGIVFKLNRN